MLLLALLTPIFLIFEIWQLVMCERHLGLKQIASGSDPRRQGPAETTAFFWSVLLISYWVWMMLLFMVPEVRVQGAGLLVISVLGYTIRRGAPLRWILVVLTFEGAIRLGLLFSLATTAWRELV
jgi:hypothetical protein